MMELIRKLLHKLKFKLLLILVGTPYGLLGKIYDVEDNHNGKYTFWDRVRYKWITGESLKKV